ncbi:MAG: hypothetical protein ACLTDV_13330 [Eubacterium sp.]
MENKVLDAYLDGWNYRRELPRKKIGRRRSGDNAPQRIHRNEILEAPEMP